MEKYLPHKRLFGDGQKATLEDLKKGRKIAAQLLMRYPAILPIFQRLDNEIRQLEHNLADIERARQFI